MKDVGVMRDEIEARVREAAADCGVPEDDAFFDMAADYIAFECPIGRRRELARALGVQIRDGVEYLDGRGRKAIGPFDPLGEDLFDIFPRRQQ